MTFTERVYEIVRSIPAGSVSTYQEVAERAGRPRAARAVGQAMRRNPWSYITHPHDPRAVPCHRVIAKNFKLGGFNSGLTDKVKLLEAEGWMVTEETVRKSGHE